MNYQFPRVTLITPSFNQAAFLEEAINSVLAQDYPNIQYIIIDGGSTDGSLEIIRKYEPWLDYWICEKDDGQTDAINKGMEKANGDLVNWLNSDDLLLPGALTEIAKNYSTNRPDFALLCGHSKVINASGDEIGSSYSRHISTQEKPLPQSPNIYEAAQASVFLTKKAWDLVGGLNADLNYTMDTDLYYRCHAAGIPFILVDAFLSAYRQHDQTKTHHGWRESTEYKRKFYYSKLAELKPDERKIKLPRVQQMMFGFYMSSVWHSDPIVVRTQKILSAIGSYPSSLFQPHRLKRMVKLFINP